MTELRLGDFVLKTFMVGNDDKFLLCGMDEVGRGAFAGPLVAAGVILPKGFSHELLRDSKLLTANQRRKMDLLIRETALAVEVELITVREINAKGLGWANKEVFVRLVERVVADGYCCDGNLRIEASKEIHCLVGGDSIIPAIAAASIVAKVHRDNLMVSLHEEAPWFGWDKNKGYGSARHLVALGERGAHSEHREVFVANWRRKVADRDMVNSNPEGIEVSAGQEEDGSSRRGIEPKVF